MRKFLLQFRLTLTAVMFTAAIAEAQSVPAGVQEYYVIGDAEQIYEMIQAMVAMAAATRRRPSPPPRTFKPSSTIIGKTATTRTRIPQRRSKRRRSLLGMATPVMVAHVTSHPAPQIRMMSSPWTRPSVGNHVEPAPPRSPTMSHTHETPPLRS